MSKKTNGRPTTTPELPAALAEALRRAESGTFPSYSPEEMEKLPHLCELMKPMLVANPRYKGSAEPNKVLREPLAMISWDRMSGMWKFALGDKILDFSGAVAVSSLLTALLEAEAALRNGTFPFKRKKLDW